MKISPVSSAGNTIGGVVTGDQQVSRVQSLRSIKMSTNATPAPRNEAFATPITDQSLPITANIDDANPAGEVTQPLSPQFAALAKQKRALQQQEQDLARRKAEFESKSGSQADMINLAEFKADPIGLFLKHGGTYDDLTNFVLKNQGNPDIEALKAEMKSLREGFDKKLTDREEQNEKAALTEMQREAVHLAATGSDFETVREMRAIPHVMRLIKETYKSSGEVLDVRQALKLIEDELVDDGLKVARLQKVQAKLAPQAPAPLPSPQQHRQMRTLTNRDTASVPMDRRARALAAALGQLKR